MITVIPIDPISVERQRIRRPRAMLRRHWHFVAATLTPLIVFSPWVISGRLIAPGDGWNAFLPLHILAGQMWRSGEVPEFNPYQYGGWAFLAQDQPAVLYPPQVLFAVLPPGLAHNLYMVLVLMVASSGAAAFTWLLTRDRWGAVVAGVAFGFSGFMIARIGHPPVVATISWLPWALLSADLLARRLSVLRVLAGSAVLALAIFAGHPQMLAQVLLALGFYVLTLAATGSRGHRLRPLIGLALMGVGGALLGAPQLLSTLAILDTSFRSVFTFEAAMEYSLPVSHLTLQLFPYLFGQTYPSGPFIGEWRGEWNSSEMTAYPGIVVLVLAIAGLSVLRRDRRAAAMLLLAVIGTALMLGASTPLARLLFEVPFFGQFRVWSRYGGMVTVAIAVLAGYGVAALRSPERRRLAVILSSTAAGAVLIAAIVLPNLESVQQRLTEPGTVRAAVLVGAVAALIAGAIGIAIAVLPRRWPVAILVPIAVVADLMLTFGLWYEWRTASPDSQVLDERLAEPGGGFGGVADSPGGIDRYLFIGGTINSLPEAYNLAATEGLRSANGSDSLGPYEYSEVVGILTPYGEPLFPDRLLPPASKVPDVLRVTTVLDDEHPNRVPESIPPDVIFGPGVRLPGRSITRYEYVPRVADAYLVGAARTATHEEALSAAGGAAPLDLSAEVVVEGRCDSCPTVPGVAGQVTRSEWSDKTITLNVEAHRDAMLVISTAFFPGWSATVDGKPVEHLRANALVIALPVPAGSHTLELNYEAPGFRLGILLAAGFIALCGLLVFLSRLRMLRSSGGRDQRASAGAGTSAVKPTPHGSVAESNEGELAADGRTRSG